MKAWSKSMKLIFGISLLSLSVCQAAFVAGLKDLREPTCNPNCVAREYQRHAFVRATRNYVEAQFRLDRQTQEFLAKVQAYQENIYQKGQALAASLKKLDESLGIEEAFCLYQKLQDRSEQEQKEFRSFVNQFHFWLSVLQHTYGRYLAELQPLASFIATYQLPKRGPLTSIQECLTVAKQQLEQVYQRNLEHQTSYFQKLKTRFKGPLFVSLRAFTNAVERQNPSPENNIDQQLQILLEKRTQRMEESSARRIYGHRLEPLYQFYQEVLCFSKTLHQQEKETALTGLGAVWAKQLISEAQSFNTVEVLDQVQLTLSLSQEFEKHLVYGQLKSQWEFMSSTGNPFYLANQPLKELIVLHDHWLEIWEDLSGKREEDLSFLIH